MSTLIIPPWISFRPYEDKNGKFALISNARMHELAFIEEFHVILMEEIGKEKTSTSIGDLKKKYPGYESEINEIIAELLDNDIIISGLPKSNSYKSQFPSAPPPYSIGNSDKSNDYTSLELSAISRIEQAGYLYSFFWEITYKCNEACIHCYNPGAAHKKGDKNKRKTDLLTRNETIKLLDDLVEIGVFRLLLSGGEAFLHKDFFFILEEAKKRNFQVIIFTNGLLLDEKTLDRLENLYPDEIGITIYSDDDQRHDEVTRIGGSHEKSINALKELHKRGIRTHTKTPLMKETANDFEATRELSDSLGSRQTVDGYLVAGNDNNLDPIKLNLDINQIAELAFVKGSPYFIDKSNNFGRRDRDAKQSVCSAGINIMSITPNGKITTCPSLPLEVADLREKSMVEVWKDKDNVKQWKPQVRPSRIDNEVRAIKIFDPDNPAISHAKLSNARPGTLAEWRSIKLENYIECGTHDRCTWCNAKCPGAAMNETGDPLEKSEVQCKIAYAKMVVAQALESGKTKNQVIEMVRNQYS
jgi:MoaA/NifB/PqqE/SkfB family radical SAM enzyme